MSASAKSTSKSAQNMRKSFLISEGLQDVLKIVSDALMGKETVPSVSKVGLLASGGYNDVWLVEFSTSNTESGHESPNQEQHTHRFILREPKEDAFLPHQLENDVGWLRWVAKHTSIPVPKVYAYSSFDNPFIAMEFMDGRPMSDEWKQLDEMQKESLAKEVATLVVEMAEAKFDQIGGISPQLELAPTVEGAKFFKGRNKFHAHEHYNIGPYSSTLEYVLACYDKEICYYSNASYHDIDWSLLDDADDTEDDFVEKLPEHGPKRQQLLDTKAKFVDELRSTRDRISQDPSDLRSGPFVLCHGDLQARNIMVKEGRITGVIDWEFAGSYPLGEVLGGGSVDVVELESDEDEEENAKWAETMRDLVRSVAEQRGWAGEDIRELLDGVSDDLQAARLEMMPKFSD